jgi:uncharacterized protein YndB with AHSA1/START domain
MAGNRRGITSHLAALLFVQLAPINGFFIGALQQTSEKPALEAGERITSSIERTRAGELILVELVRIGAPIDKVWHAYSTSEGYASWAAPAALVDLKVGGTIRTHYNKAAKIGDPHTITLHVVNYVPYKLLTLQTDPTGNWPDILKQQAEDLFNVILFEAQDDGKTRITSYGLGYRDTPEMHEMLQFFAKANKSLHRELIALLEGS